MTKFRHLIVTAVAAAGLMLSVSHSFAQQPVDRGDQPKEMPPVILAPSSGGEVRFGKKLLPDYPEEFSPGEYLLVLATLL